MKKCRQSLLPAWRLVFRGEIRGTARANFYGTARNARTLRESEQQREIGV
jgi:hypothetical protein